jgi:RNA polymerase sigma-70 factor (ECF subfamily)
MKDPFRAELVELLPRLRRFALGLTAHPDRADDLVQAGCERALARQRQWEPGTRLDSWLYKILQNLWIDQLRASREMTAEPEEIENVPDRDWDSGFEARLTLEQVVAAMGRLPAPMRAVLTLVCIDGQSYKEAAAALDVPIGTVMSRLARARLELHRVLHAGPAGEEVDHAHLH